MKIPVCTTVYTRVSMSWCLLCQVTGHMSQTLEATQLSESGHCDSHSADLVISAESGVNVLSVAGSSYYCHKKSNTLMPIISPLSKNSIQPFFDTLSLLRSTWLEKWKGICKNFSFLIIWMKLVITEKLIIVYFSSFVQKTFFVLYKYCF